MLLSTETDLFVPECNNSQTELVRFEAQPNNKNVTFLNHIQSFFIYIYSLTLVQTRCKNQHFKPDITVNILSKPFAFFHSFQLI